MVDSKQPKVILFDIGGVCGVVFKGGMLSIVMKCHRTVIVLMNKQTMYTLVSGVSRLRAPRPLTPCYRGIIDAIGHQT
ncbi:hypothetical protein HYQ46_013282 [Verticillium longisporum]|nr:hypothetical protein HYQ46_013282 [Verticillium longisporum]